MIPIRGLYAITPDHSQQDWPCQLNKIQAFFAGGGRILQYRNKYPGDKPTHRDLIQLKDICTRHDGLLVVNDDLDLALTIDAPGLHLGQADTALEYARARFRGIIGVSCYNRLDFARRAEAYGADYVAFGRFYPSSTKPLAVQATLELLQLAKQEVTVPLVAIGGINLENAIPIIEAGADAVAAIKSVFSAQDVCEITRRFNQLFKLRLHNEHY